MMIRARAPKCLVVEQRSAGPATGSVIFLHGSGDTGNGVERWIEMLLGKEMNFPHLRVLYPTAPSRRYTPNNGRFSNVWFDRREISPMVPDDDVTVNDAARSLRTLIESEEKCGIPINKIVIGGFSMGGAMAMHVGYRFCPQLAGVFALSSFLNHDSLVYQKLKREDEERKPPLLMFHGENDPLSSLQWGLDTHERLNLLGVASTFTPLRDTFHEMKKTEIQLVMEWIGKVVPQE